MVKKKTKKKKASNIKPKKKSSPYSRGKKALNRLRSRY